MVEECLSLCLVASLTRKHSGQYNCDGHLSHTTSVLQMFNSWARGICMRRREQSFEMNNHISPAYYKVSQQHFLES